MSPTTTSSQTIDWQENFVVGLYRVLQAARFHKDNNELVKAGLDNFRQAIVQANLNDDLTMVLSEGRFYLCDEQLKYRKDLVRIINELLVFFQTREIYGIKFDPTASEARNAEIVLLIRALLVADQKAEPYHWLGRQLQRKNIHWVTILPNTDIRRASLDSGLTKRARHTYYNAVTALRQVSHKISTQGASGIRKAKRMIQSMVDFAIEEESILLGLSTIKDHDDYTYTHSVNVAVLSLCLGNRLGLSRNSLERLGICGLFHDLGKVEIDLQILNKPSSLNDAEMKEVRKHPLASVRQILKMQASHEIKSTLLLAPYEHHLHNDLSGYPTVHFIKSVSLFGRILHITDVYDAITSPRIYRQSVLSPDQALAHMLKGAGPDFDPLLLKVFAMMMGAYPPGTLLQFGNGDIGVVADYPAESEASFPRVVILERDPEGGVKPGKWVDLAEKDPATGAYLRQPVRTLNPALYGIQPVDFIL